MNGIEARKIIERTKSHIKSRDLQIKISKLEQSMDYVEILNEAHQLSIALAMLVKNQEENIQEVLEKVQKLKLDEYIVVDTGSTDQTVSVLRMIENIKLYEISWVEDFAFMRNKVAELTSADWILTLDSDEILISEDIDLKLLVYLLNKVGESDFSINFVQRSIGKSSYDTPSRIYCPSRSTYFGLVHEELRDKITGKAVGGVMTDIQIINQGTLPKEIQKFSKEERYMKLSKKMMEIEPDNPRWFVLMSGNVSQLLMKEENYEEQLKKYLFKNSDSGLSEKNILQNTYTRILLEKYSLFLIIHGRLAEAQELSTFGLKLFPLDIYLMFYQSLSQLEFFKLQIKNLLKRNLNQYLTLDTQQSSDYNNTDTQLLELLLAELNLMLGKVSIATKISENLTDKNVLDIWENWHSF